MGSARARGGAILATGFLAMLLAGCSQEAEEGSRGEIASQQPPARVSVVSVESASLPVVNELPGRIAATRMAEVRPRVSGIVVERVFEQGSMVKAGDVLYRIDPESFRVRVQSAEAMLARARAAQLLAKQQAERQSQLRERKIASEQQLDSSVALLAQADADVAIAEAGLAEARLNLAYSEIQAPISGRIGRAIVTEGALVTANGSESLATIQQIDPVYADFTQSANDLMRLRRALKVGELASPDTVPVELRFDDGSTYPHAGRLLFSEASVDQTTGQVTLRGEFPNPDGDLLPGMYVRVVVEQGIEPDAIAVPQQAVQRDPSGNAVLYLVDSDNQVVFRTVRLARPAGDRFVVAEGLAPGERVIVEGFQKIAPGATVEPVTWKEPATRLSSAGRNTTQ